MKLQPFYSKYTRIFLQYKILIKWILKCYNLILIFFSLITKILLQVEQCMLCFTIYLNKFRIQKGITKPDFTYKYANNCILQMQPLKLLFYYTDLFINLVILYVSNIKNFDVSEDLKIMCTYSSLFKNMH